MQKKWAPFWTKAALIMALAILPGCASVGFEAFKVAQAGQRPMREEKAGLIVSCRPITSAQEAAFFFGFNLLDRQVLPVLVYLENRSDDNFTFHPERLALHLENGDSLTYTAWRDVYGKVAFSYWRSLAGFPFALFPGFFIMHSVSSANERIAADYHGKSLDEITLTPGVHTQGVVFLSREDGEALDIQDIPCADFQLYFSQQTTHQTADFDVVFHLKG